VLIADDQAQVRSALRLLLEQASTVAVAGEAGNAQELLTQVQVGHPDLVLLDWELPCAINGEQGPQSPQALLSLLRQIHPALQVIALSGRPEAPPAALEAGADVFVSKGDPPERVLQAIQCCVRGRQG
jgi:DNA-binding NarL/FixJ family response regulator